MSIQNCAVVIAGASGDLTRRKLMPALDALFSQGKLDDSDIIVGTGRTFFSDDEFRNRFAVSPQFGKNIYYHQYISGLREFIHSKGSFSRVVFFLSEPPVAYVPTARELLAEGFGEESSIIIEKPFGYDYESAVELNRELGACFDESQIFRIDHYLGKEAVQNILVFRFANRLLHPVWNNEYIESIQVNALEQEGIVERGAYFDKAGIIRDMVQNHLMQLLSLLTMEAPVSLDPMDIRAQKVNALRAFSISEVHRYQYDGYAREKGVDPASTTETFAELKLTIDNFRWAGVPVFIRTGKAVHRRGTEIGIRFKPLPRILFNTAGQLQQNQIVFKIQPAEGIIIDMSSKVPGTDSMITPTPINFCYRDAFNKEIPEAYQRLLFDALKGDHTLFVGALETEAAWRLFKGVLDKGEVVPYPRGTMPPSAFPIQWIDFDSYIRYCA